MEDGGERIAKPRILNPDSYPPSSLVIRQINACPHIAEGTQQWTVYYHSPLHSCFRRCCARPHAPILIKLLFESRSERNPQRLLFQVALG